MKITKMIQRANILSLFVLIALLVPSIVCAQSSKNETKLSGIEDDGTRFSLNYALPVEMVEEAGEVSLESPVFEITSPRKTIVSDDDSSDIASAHLIGPSESEKRRMLADDAPNARQETTLLNVKDAELTSMIKTFSRLTKRNYVVDSSVKGKVTIHLTTAVSVAEALRIFDSVLLMKGYTTVPIGNNTWKVVSAKDAKKTTIPLVRGQGEHVPSDQLVTQFLRLKHVTAADMQKLLTQYISKDGIINSFSSSNSLIIVDSEANIARLREMVNHLDVPALDQDLTIIPILYADVKDIAEKINEIMGEKKDSSSTRSTSRSRRNRSSSKSSSGTNVTSSRSLPLKVLADERTNSLIVLADPELTTRVRALVEKLDSRIDLGGGRFYVYRLKHADSEEVAEIVQNLISGGNSSSSGSSSARTGSSISRSQTNRNSSSRSSTQTPAQRLAEVLRRRREARSSSRSQKDAGKVNFEGEVSIASDAATNSLIINATREDYKRIETLLEELDVKRPQVIVEATILEVTLNKTEGVGVEWQMSGGNDNGGLIAQNNFGGLTNLITNPAGLSDLTIAAASTGTITLPGGLVIPSQSVLVTALSRNSNVNVLSAPTILTTDNEEAEIIVGENVPFVTSTSTDSSNINNTFNSIERQDVGITLRITPQISSGNFVNLKIFVEISNVVQATRNDPNGPTTTIRTTETNVAIKSNQMVVTGGLISDNVTESTRGVPWLQDIPVLGNLFQRADTVHNRTNLLIFITPKIITDQYEARETTLERKDSIAESLRPFGDDLNRSDILSRESLDSVVDKIDAPDVIPSTIMPPKKITVLPKDLEVSTEKPKESLPAEASSALNRTEERLKKLIINPRKEMKTSSDESSEDEIIDVSVAPSLPGVKKNAPSPRPSLKPSARSALSAQQTFVVLRSASGKTIGLELLGGQGTAGADFFNIGQSYAKKIDDSQETFFCIGKFSAREQAAKLSQELGDPRNWYPLSPKELLALGSGPWFRS